MIGHLGLGSNVQLGLVDFKVCDWPLRLVSGGQSQTLKSCWPIKTSLSWLTAKLKNPQDQVGHLSLGLHGHQPSENGGHLGLLQLHGIRAKIDIYILMVCFHRDKS